MFFILFFQTPRLLRYRMVFSHCPLTIVTYTHKIKNDCMESENGGPFLYIQSDLVKKNQFCKAFWSKNHRKNTSVMFILLLSKLASLLSYLATPLLSKSLHSSSMDPQIYGHPYQEHDLGCPCNQCKPAWPCHCQPSIFLHLSFGTFSATLHGWLDLLRSEERRVGKECV